MLTSFTVLFFRFPECVEPKNTAAWQTWPTLLGWILVLLNRNEKCWIWMVTQKELNFIMTYDVWAMNTCIMTFTDMRIVPLGFLGTILDLRFLVCKYFGLPGRSWRVFQETTDKKCEWLTWVTDWVTGMPISREASASKNMRGVEEGNLIYFLFFKHLCFPQ